MVGTPKTTGKESLDGRPDYSILGVAPQDRHVFASPHRYPVGEEISTEAAGAGLVGAETLQQEEDQPCRTSHVRGVCAVNWAKARQHLTQSDGKASSISESAHSWAT